jgi:N-acetylmuramoyl-L-alanine amidase
MKVVYISPSTQHDNIGAGNYRTECDRMNEIADIVVPELERHGIIVYRNTPTMSLSDVVEDSNKYSPDLHFAIHSNAGGGRGAEVYCHRFGGVGEIMARNVYAELSALTPVNDRGVHEGANFYGQSKPMYELAYTTAPAALAEVEFHDAIDGANLIIANIRPIGQAIVRGILKTLNIEYKPLEGNKEYTFSVKITLNNKGEIVGVEKG